MPTTAPASTAAVAAELVALCRAGRNLDAIERLYARDVRSIEPVGSEEMPAEVEGIDAVRAKNHAWFDNHEVHGAEVNGPFVGENNQFAVQYSYDITFKPTGQRTGGTEMALYTVEDGRIVQEQFFYQVPAQGE